MLEFVSARNSNRIMQATRVSNTLWVVWLYDPRGTKVAHE